MADCMTSETVNYDQMHNGNGEVPGPLVNGIDGSGDGAVVNSIKKEATPAKSSSESKHHSSSSKHKSSHSDKHRDGEHRSSSDKHKHSSSSDKHKHSSSSHKHSGSSDKHKSSSSSSDKHKSSSGSSDKHKSSSGSSSDKHKSSSSSSDKHKHSSSGDKHKHSSSSSDKHKSGSSSSSKDKSKSSSSSSSSKHHSSSKDKSHSSSSHKSSSSGDKHRSDKDKHRSEKEKSHENKENTSGDKKVEIKKEVMPIKTEPISVETPSKAIPMDDSDDDVPLAARKEVQAIKKEVEKRPAAHSDAEDEEPLSERVKKMKTEEGDGNIKKRKSDQDDDYTPSAKKKKNNEKKKKQKIKEEPVRSPVKAIKKESGSPTKKGGKVKKEDPDQPQKWKWWEEQAEREEGVKWTFLEHKGVVFAPDYEPLPSDVKFYYDGKVLPLSQDAEEVAGFYAKMLDHDYTTREVFNRNFFKDFRKVMTSKEQSIITDLKKCNFRELYTYFKQKSEERKNMSKEEKKKIKEQNEALVKEYGFCTIDGHTEKVGNFRIEPPSLFRGRGEHPKQGVLKRRVVAENIIINCSKDAKVPEPPAGHRWKEVRHDPGVTWLASWNENVQNQTKYVMLAATSKLKGEKDMMKYEKARELHQRVDKIRANYREDFKSKEMRIRQRSVALYFIDKLALRAGNEKDEETADTVGCCSLRWEHIKLHLEKAGKENVVEFDFLGKDSIRYHNEVSVEKRVFKNLQLFMENKNKGDDLFDRLNTTIMNKHLNTLMEGLTAKVFRTYNASRTLQEQLDLLTNPEDAVAAKILAYNRANRAVAVLCNHQRAVSKNFSKQMENMQAKIDAKKDAVHGARKDVKAAKSDYKALKTEAKRKMVDRKKKILERLESQLEKLEISMTDKDENKEIALGTSKLNYLDPRISVAWCKKWEVPIEKIYNKTQRDKFAWAVEMADEEYKFTEFDEN